MIIKIKIDIDEEEDEPTFIEEPGDKGNQSKYISLSLFWLIFIEKLIYER